MIIGVAREIKPGERRVALTPDTAGGLIQKGFTVHIESGAGVNSFYDDTAYKAAGTVIFQSKTDILSNADILVKVNAPSDEEIELMKEGAVLISFMFASSNPDLVKQCARKKISAFSLDSIPRISRAQSMDALSSQSNLAGYKAVMLAGNALGKVFPLMMTAAGTVKPAKVVIMGAGVAGLQAVATAKRLGAIVEVSDIRPETKEQVESLGGKFIEVKGDDSVRTEGGYVKEVSAEFLKKQKEVVARHVAEADVVITTALLPGKKAPLLITEEMVKAMRFGSVILDMAVEQGGNCAISEAGKTVVKHGVTIIGEMNLPSLLPVNASELFAKNISTFLLHLADSNGFKWDMNDEITKGSLIVHRGVIEG
ncbi:MAG: Re/Si-specific NAD(P)(+) transhydrogenase subunit alpha [Bacteroidetes bacterium]|nr:Re/Si-specific NAD(P)(+) transhydrogenase subunit alpha [Bacteroidota bacterium]